jgi:hypothetical protein
LDSHQHSITFIRGTLYLSYVQRICVPVWFPNVGNGRILKPIVGVEPTTSSLQGKRSTSELNRQTLVFQSTYASRDILGNQMVDVGWNRTNSGDIGTLVIMWWM